jgi:CRP-like cAMP-binding protein
MLTHTQILDRFAARVMPEGSDDTARLQFAAAARAISVAREGVARLDQSCDQLVYLSSGSTKLVAHATHDREQVIGFHFAGDLLCIPARAHHSYSLVALRDTELVATCYDKVLELFGAHPGVLEILLESTRASLDRCREKAIALGRKTAPERVASFLIAMATRTGRTEEGAMVLSLPMSRRDIADSIGITIETVSRQLTILREQGVIETVGRSEIRILDMQRLTEGAGFLPGRA